MHVDHSRGVEIGISSENVRPETTSGTRSALRRVNALAGRPCLFGVGQLMWSGMNEGRRGVVGAGPLPTRILGDSATKMGHEPGEWGTVGRSVRRQVRHSRRWPGARRVAGSGHGWQRSTHRREATPTCRTNPPVRGVIGGDRLVGEGLRLTWRPTASSALRLDAAETQPALTRYVSVDIGLPVGAGFINDAIGCESKRHLHSNDPPDAFGNRREGRRAHLPGTGVPSDS